MADEWYFGWGDRRFGPFSETQLKELAERGRIQPADTIWKLGIEKGLLADKIKNLFPPSPVETAPAVENAPVALEPGEARRRTADISGSLPSTSAKFNEWLASTDNQIADGKKQEIVPDGITLRALAGHDDSPSPFAPAREGSAVSEVIEQRKSVATPSTRGTADPSPSNPLVSGNVQASTETKPTKQKRAIALKGAVISSQDGEMVQFRKKCIRCAFEDPSRTTRPIRMGIHRDRFFCPKCRKTGEVEIQGIT